MELDDSYSTEATLLGYNLALIIFCSVSPSAH